MTPRLLMLFVMIVGATSVSAQKAASELGLRELIEVAEQRNFSMTEGRLASESAESLVIETRARLLPKLLVESAASYNAREEWISSGALVLRQSLYDGGQSWTGFRRSRLRREQAELDEVRLREGMVFEVLRAYATLSRLERNRAASRRKLGLLEQQFGMVGRQFRQGLKTQRDYQLLEAEVERSRLEIEHLENEIFRAFRELEKVVGAPELSLDATQVKLLSAEDVLAKRDWVELSTKFSPDTESLELRSLLLSVEDRSLALDLTKRQYWPVLDVSAYASYGSGASSAQGVVGWRDNAAWNSGLALTLSWTLWDWGGVPAQVAQAKASHLLEERRVEQKRLELTKDFSVLLQNVQRRERVLEIQRKIRSLEGGSFRDIQTGYREGRATYLDLITAIERDIQSELSFENETFSYFLAMAELMRLKGLLYESIKNL
jgi:outer membrane protein TolC